MIIYHITVITNEDELKSIHETDFINRYRPTEEMIEMARELVKKCYPNHRMATIHLDHYDKYGDNDKCNLVQL